MTGTVYTCLHTNQSRSYLNHLVLHGSANVREHCNKILGFHKNWEFIEQLKTLLFTVMNMLIGDLTWRLSIRIYSALLKEVIENLTFRGPCIVSIFVLIYFQRDANLHSLFISEKLLYMFRVLSSPIIRSTYNCTYSIWYLLTITAICLYCRRFGAGFRPAPTLPQQRQIAVMINKYQIL